MGSACSHFAALLFKVEACCRIKENKFAVTSQLWNWNRSRKSAEPSLLKNFNFKKPKKDDFLQEPLDENANTNYTMKRFRSSQVSIPLEEFQQLKQIVTNVAFFKIVDLDEQESAESFINSDTDTADDSELNCIPEPLTSLYDATAINLSSEKLSVLCEKIYCEYVASYLQVFFNNLTEITKLQSLSSAPHSAEKKTNSTGWHDTHKILGGGAGACMFRGCSIYISVQSIMHVQFLKLLKQEGIFWRTVSLSSHTIKFFINEAKGKIQLRNIFDTKASFIPKRIPKSRLNSPSFNFIKTRSRWLCNPRR